MIKCIVDTKSLKNNQKTYDACVVAKESIINSFYQHGKSVEILARNKILEPPKTGNIYYIHELKRNHQASAPGQAPANMLGNLQKSLTYAVGPSEMYFGSSDKYYDVYYAKDLELGNDRIKPRPYLKPSIRETQGDLQDEFYTQLRNGFGI